MDDPALTHARTLRNPEKAYGELEHRVEKRQMYLDTCGCFLCVDADNWTDGFQLYTNFSRQQLFYSPPPPKIGENDIWKRGWEWTINGHLSINSKKKNVLGFWLEAGCKLPKRSMRINNPFVRKIWNIPSRQILQSSTCLSCRDRPLLISTPCWSLQNSELVF